MSRYIDAEWLKELFPDTGEGEWTYNATALGYIDSAPSIDIVRCKECKWFDDSEHCPCDVETPTGRYITDLGNDGYCSHGERREP